MDQDLEKTRLQWRQLKELSIKKKAPYLLFQHPLVPDQMLNHYQSFDFSDITFDNRKTLNDMQLAFPRLANKMRIRKETNKIAGKEIQQWLIEAIESVVHKQDGITLTIEQTEALTVIDIDSNKFTSRQNKQETMYRINQKALKYCLEEIQKRNLSGIILIDFLKMRKAEEAALLKQMQVTVKEDPLPTQVFGFTRLGLMELTRKRERTGLIQLLTNHSASARLPLSAETIAYQLERELISWNDGNIESMIILCHEEVVAFFNRFIKQHVKTKIHFTLYCQTDNKSCEFQVIRAGSDDLIEEYIKQHQEIAVDRML
ncbi:cytoplasmic axial filament protein CafA and ribonuclease G [Gracilibacillus boraciitolerans JCM 21714]|uniref:Cytoplasmic axial filament protein CafA and ribonuclease G n=1 Tax=Gracilibacillus boraciitolerans JCM 21714 TaxID=1298598 RepID=W4VIG2_9BACI|nr:ribonuclease E/G [Gracilibacillus boraciitolerans]GAE92608.1 cytoplasmic axial filament protein CafA and ribonuclease G [Gracilibacillus boraciitolerans JCM 21714]